MGSNADFGLYIHWPFCQSKCPYCDFNSHVARQIDAGRWTRAYLSEIDRISEEASDQRLATVFFGGGTPSLMPPELVHAILDRVRARWEVANDWEVTLEANPGSVEAGRFRAFRDAGVNRVSMGIQALNDADLQRLGRLHTAQEARSAFDVARGAFDKVSFDLIYARQEQTLEAWKAELQEALAMAVDHLSLYQLTIEQGTAFGDLFRVGKLRGLPDDEVSADLFDLTQDLCGNAGFVAYEVSNHARLGSESRHNLIYWRSGAYAGIGPGAHGRLEANGHRIATEALRAPESWLKAVETAGTGEVPRIVLSGEDRATEYVIMGMRILEGIEIATYETLAGRPMKNDALEELQDLGLIKVSDGRLRTTPAGRPLLDAVIRKLLQ